MTRLPSPHARTRPIRENSRISGVGTGLNAHRLVAETAVKLAHEYYEPYMSANNELYKAARRSLTERQWRLAFVRQAEPQLLEEARLALTDMLSKPDDVVSLRLKDETADALIKDSDFRANRLRAAEHMPASLLH